MKCLLLQSSYLVMLFLLLNREDLCELVHLRVAFRAFVVPK